MRARGLGVVLACVSAITGCGDSAVTARPPAPIASSVRPTAVAKPSILPSQLTGTPSGPALPTGSPAIPWLDAPAQADIPPDVNALVTNPVLYRTCTAADLTGRASGWGGAMGTAYEYVWFTNRSSSSCTLSGNPVAVTDVYRDGTRHRIAAPLRSSGFGNQEDAVANLRPGQVGGTQLTQTEDCDGWQHFFYVPRFDVELPDGSQVPIIVPGSHYQAPVAGCHLAASWFGTLHTFVPEPTYPTDPLVATVNLPGQIRAGSTFDYTVTLTNPTAKAIPLSPCLTYEEHVTTAKPDTAAASVGLYYQLNCAGNPVVPAHQPLTFAMRIPAPKQAGSGWLTWRLQPTNVIVGLALTLLP
jgi:hypothetical protein